jgi:hypothetical protein
MAAMDELRGRCEEIVWASSLSRLQRGEKLITRGIGRADR